MGKSAWVLWSSLLVSGLMIHTAVADQMHEPIYDQYSLQASAEGEVDNDLMRVRLQVQHEDRDAAALAAKVNSDMQWALDQLMRFDTITYNTGNYSTYPKYEQQRVIGWQSTQSLLLSGADFDALKNALQTLQARLQIQSMSFSPSEETRRKAEDELINQALDNLKHRAEIVQKNMGAGSYRVMHLNIDTGPLVSRQPRMEATMMRSNRAEVAPAVEGGESKISVNVSGQIQLQ